MNKIKVKWQDVEDYIHHINDKYNDKNLSGVYGLPRGGLIFAVMVSHLMNIPLLNAPINGCLIIDDICDSGESLLHYERNSSAVNKPLYHISTMYYKENNLVVPEYYWGTKKDEWIVFPWEFNNV